MKDIENKNIIYSIVRDKFSLEDDSLRLFKERLFNPVVDDIYKSFELDENLRKYWPLRQKELGSLDEGWKKFSVKFPSFADYYDLTYSDFVDNKVTIGKNRVKLLKALVDYYLYNKETKIAIDLLYGKMEDTYLLKNYPEDNVFFENIEYSEKRKFMEFVTHDKGVTTADELGRRHKELYKDFIKKEIREEMEFVGQYKLPKKSLYLVLSCNFADWFLCSTSENWSSCLSLRSNYSFWSGIPGLITDTNRAMLYITDKSRKEYRGIEADKMMARRWLLLTSENEISMVKWYPSSFLSENKIKEITGSSKFVSAYDGGNFRSVESKNSFPLLFHNKGDISSYIYQDNTDLFFDGLKNEFGLLIKFNDHGSGMQFYDKKNNDFIYDDVFSNFLEGLDGLYNHNLSVENMMSEEIHPSSMCERCGDTIYEDDIVYGPDGDTYCTDCYEDVFTVCSNCRDIIPRSEIQYDDNSNGPYCEECYETLVEVCSDCGHEVDRDLENFHEVGSKIVCEMCFDSHYIRCDKCQNIFDKNDIVETGVLLVCKTCLEKEKNEEKEAV